MFGDVCAGKQTGIRERIGWIVPNQHLDTPEVRVFLELANDRALYGIERRWSKGGKRSAAMELILTLPNGETLTGPDAELHLAQLSGATFRDFLTTVYQHQEAIRAVLTQEPRERNDALDRLLGLSVYRNLLDVLTKVKATDRQKSIRQQFEAFEQEVRAVLSARDKDLKELRQEAIEAGVVLAQQHEKSVLDQAKSLRQTLIKFAGQIGLAAPALTVPTILSSVAPFEMEVRQAIHFLRSEMPDAKEQADLYRRQQAVLQLQTDLEHARAGLTETKKELQRLDQRSGGQKATKDQLERASKDLAAAREKLRQTNARAALVREAIRFIEGPAAGQSADHCPLCDQPMTNLLADLRQQWEGQLQTQVASIHEEIKKGEHRQQELQTLVNRYDQLAQALQVGIQKLALIVKKIEDFFGKPIGEDDDPGVLLIMEFKKLETRGQALQQVIKDKQHLLEGMEGDLGKLRLVREILLREEKKNILEKIQTSPAYRDMETLRDQVADWVCDLDSIHDAVATVAREEAQGKLQAAEKTIEAFFRRLTGNPAVCNLRLQVSERAQRNHYDITDQNGQDLAPILSQGDLNALALAIFLGLATANSDTGTFGFVMLDDPSQSLGSEHKKNLVQVLEEVARQKHVLLATMDGEFHDLVSNGLSKAKSEFVFGSWTPEKGPEVTQN